MDESTAFLAQARSDFAIYQMLAGYSREEVPECHALHYLQMATEKLAKAVAIRLGHDENARHSHVAFSSMPVLLNRRDVSAKLGWDNHRQFIATLRRLAPLFDEIEAFNPAVARDKPNVEYPWRKRPSSNADWLAPVQYSFGFLERLRRKGDMKQLIMIITTLLERFDSALPKP